jgi:hypothetical protein
MSVPVVFSRIHQLKNIANFESLPQAVLLDFGEERREFLSVCDDLEDFEANIDEVLGEVLMYLVDDAIIEQSLQDLHNDMLAFYTREHHGVEASIVASAFCNFARGLHTKFKHLGMYTKEKLLPYVMKNRADEQTIFLVRYAEDKYNEMLRQEPR